MEPVLAVYDACVLYSAPLRDLLLHLAGVGLVHPRWTDAIHEEWTRNLLANRPDLTRAQLERTRAFMERAVPEAQVRGYESRIPALTLPDEDDRHVLATAIEAGAKVIVTFNLADFPTTSTAPHGVAAVHPDDFVVGLLDANQETVWAALRNQRRLLKNPPVTAVGMLETLRHQGLIRATARLEAAVDRF
jgi:predicted nucleic acid-binding protein